MIPDDLLYTAQHEWVRLDGPYAEIGITEHAAEQMGDITFVELPDVGKTFAPHDTVATLESSKAASDVYAPCPGQVAAVNETLLENPELINVDCYRAGWICRIERSDQNPPAGLLNARQYADLLKED